MRNDFELFESPCWDARRSCVWFVNVYQGQLWMFRHGVSTIFNEFPHILSSVSLTTSGKLLLTTRQEFLLYDPEDGCAQSLFSLGLEETLRINDCKVGPDGRLIFSVMDDSKPRKMRGSIGIFGAKTGVSFVIRDLLLTPNGIAPDLERNILWLADTGVKRIYRYQLNSFINAENENSLEPLNTIELCLENHARPDGASIDLDGNYLVALLEGSGLLQINGASLKCEFLPVPIANPTMCCFYGDFLDQILVTCKIAGKSGQPVMAPLTYSGRGQNSFLFNDESI